MIREGAWGGVLACGHIIIGSAYYYYFLLCAARKIVVRRTAFQAFCNRLQLTTTVVLLYIYSGCMFEKRGAVAKFGIPATVTVKTPNGVRNI